MFLLNCKNYKYFIYKITYIRCATQILSMDIKTFAFLDTETTGLPHLESNRTKITELNLTVVQADHISLGVFPRVQNQLNLCFNPRKPINDDASRITGLYNDLLESQPCFSESVSLIKEFLALQQKPVCLVAHNGNRFDYPILRAEILKSEMEFPEDILCIDSLEALRELDLQDLQDKPIDNISKTEKKVPLELQDGYDELLINAVEEAESSSTELKYKLEEQNQTGELSKENVSYQRISNSSENTVEELQKLNETTPNKNVVTQSSKHFRNRQENSEMGVRSEISKNVTSAKRRLNFGTSFKLVDVFERYTGQQAGDAHKASCDVEMLITVVATLGDRFIDWANMKAKKFCDIPPMKPGKKIGMY